MSIAFGEPIVNVPMKGSNYRIIEGIGGRFLVAFVIGKLEHIVVDGSGVPVSFNSAEQAHRWVCL